MSFGERALWSNGESTSRRSLVDEFIKEIKEEHGLRNFDAEAVRNMYKYKNQRSGFPECSRRQRDQYSIGFSSFSAPG